MRIKKNSFNPTNRLKTGIALSAGMLVRAGKSPDETLGELFLEVQERKIYEDGKTFVDLVPKKRAKAIQREYQLAKRDPEFDLREFVDRHFYEFAPHKLRAPYAPEPGTPIRKHISDLWTELERRNRRDRGSLLTLPRKYVVPGGRFDEQFYWDSYFIMLGLAADNRWDLIESMMGNYAHMLRKFGYIPTANRTYLLSRSQPPYFALMVRLLASRRGRTRTYLEYLPYMLSEYRFWMKGMAKLSIKNTAYARVVRMPDGSLLNRYFDNKSTPRPESLREDRETAHSHDDEARTYLDLRAAAESGWDFSSRWFKDPRDIKTIQTTSIIPIDLNCLLYMLEQTIADSYRAMKSSLLAKKFQDRAEKRASAIQKYCWNESRGLFADYNVFEGEMTQHDTLASVYPLYVRIATKEQAHRVAKRLEQDFLKQGGLLTTLLDTGEQWDAPNGWAPLQWTAIIGLRNYGFNELADEIKRRWVATNQKVYASEQKLIEKYDVTSDSGKGGGGEYPLQDGFGWTNGVLATLLDEE